jgi:hypothetical protein
MSILHAIRPLFLSFLRFLSKLPLRFLYCFFRPRGGTQGGDYRFFGRGRHGSYLDRPDRPMRHRPHQSPFPGRAILFENRLERTYHSVHRRQHSLLPLRYPVPQAASFDPSSVQIDAPRRQRR